jgi:IclR family transcriptional regulator, acetate operon repressor
MPGNKQKTAVTAKRTAVATPVMRHRKSTILERPVVIGHRQIKPPRTGRRRDIIARILSALDYIAQAKAPVTAADLSADLGIPRASAYRIFTRLEQEQVLIPELDGRGFTAGRRLSDFAVTVLTNSTRHGARHRVLQQLVDELGETCNLTALCGSDVVYIDRVETHWPLRMHLSPGSRVPIHCTATGKLLLSLLPERRMNELIRAAPLRRYSERTITNPDQLVAALARIRSDGVGVDDEEFAAGMVAVAVPVFDAHKQVCAALAVHAPIVRLSLKAARRHVPVLRKAAAALAGLITG